MFWFFKVINMKVKVFFKDGYVKDDKQKNVYYFLTNFDGNTKIERVISEKEYEVKDITLFD